jgi:hypothetical protein
MIFSQGLLISLGFTLVIGVLLFVFIRQKTSSIEHKVDVLFQLVQDEAAKQHKNELMHQEMQQQIASTTILNNSDNIGKSTKQNKEVIQDEDLIEVSSDSDSDSSVTTVDLENNSSDSDDGSDSDSDSDSDDGSDSHSDDGSDSHSIGNGDIGIDNNSGNDGDSEGERYSEVSNTLTDTIDEIKEIILAKPEHPIEELEIEEKELMNDNSKKMIDLFNKVDKVDNADNADNADNKSVSSVNTYTDKMNYRKTPVAKLREIAIERGIENPKSIKKLALVKLLIELDNKEQEELMDNSINHLENVEVIDTINLDMDDIQHEGSTFLKAVKKIDDETETLLEKLESEDLHNVD